MARYLLPLLIVVLLACAGASGKRQQQEDLVTSVATAGSHGPSRLTKVPKTLRRGMTPEEEAEAIREMTEEDERARQQFLEESKLTEAAVKKAGEELELAKQKLATAKMEHAKTKTTVCGLRASPNVTAQAFHAEMDATTMTSCEGGKADPEAQRLAAEKAAEEAAAEDAVREAERLLKNAKAMDTAAKTAVRNSQYIAVHKPLLGDGLSNIAGNSAGMGRRSVLRDGAFRLTVVVNAAFLLLVAQVLIV